MTQKPNDGPAFPSHGSMGEVAQEGMSLRDYFAAKAMQGYLAHTDHHKFNEEHIARCSYIVADAMLLERNKP